MSAAAQAAPHPLGPAEFDSLVSPLGPYESAPHVAAAVSGGADSLALALLLRPWVEAQGGRLTALTVDHRLRPGSAAESRRVGRILRPLGIAHRILTWEGPAPARNIQAEARRIRYDLLGEWCARHGVLHLALAHHLEDQAETLLLRLGRGSGLEGLAAMPALGEGVMLRVLRPLLTVPKARLVATLTERGLSWIEDPSNADVRHARVRLRKLDRALSAEGLTAARLAATAGRLGRARQAVEDQVSALLLRAVRLRPEGYGELDPKLISAASDEVALRGLARLLRSLGGQAYAPRLERLERLLQRLREGLAQGTIRGMTLGGCRLLPRGGRRPYLLVVRETRRLETLSLAPGRSVLWDGRFEIKVPDSAPESGLRVAALGAALRSARGHPAALRGGGRLGVPAAARPALPALRDARGLLAVPHLGYQRGGLRAQIVVKCRFTPKNGLFPAAFTVV